MANTPTLLGYEVGNPLIEKSVDPINHILSKYKPILFKKYHQYKYGFSKVMGSNNTFPFLTKARLLKYQ